MRLKTRPEDFRVIELFDFAEDPGGDHYVHTLRKSKIDTQEAIGELVRNLKVPREDIAFAGLKDRQGQTEQWISIAGRRVAYRNARMSVRFQGRSASPVTSKQSRGNRFEIVLRDLDEREHEPMCRTAAEIDRVGLPNYFDDQRFGCVRHGQGFILRDLLRGDPEAALKNLIAMPSPRALGGDVKLKQLLKRHWRDWATCAQIARGPIYSRVFEHLIADPSDYRGALERLPTRMKLIHGYAYQSHLWNRAVHEMLQHIGMRRSVRIETLPSVLSAWRAHRDSFHERLADLGTPLWGPDSDGGSPAFRAAMVGVLARDGVDRNAAGSIDVPGLMLRSEPRELVLRPRDLRIGGLQEDEEHRGRAKALLTFALPRGSYATMVVKRLVATERVRVPSDGPSHRPSGDPGRRTFGRPPQRPSDPTRGRPTRRTGGRDADGPAGEDLGARARRPRRDSLLRPGDPGRRPLPPRDFESDA